MQAGNCEHARVHEAGLNAPKPDFGAQALRPLSQWLRNHRAGHGPLRHSGCQVHSAQLGWLLLLLRQSAVIQAQCRRRCTPLRSSLPHPKFQKFQINAHSPDRRAAQPNSARPSTTQHDPARLSTATARLRTTQHGPEPLRVAPDLAGRQIELLQISPNFATHLIACMMAKPSCLSTLTCSDMPQ
jgi:hypothetical protein